MNDLNSSAPNQRARTATARRPWVTPELRTMRAGSAEAGPNPISPEGIFAIGS